MKNSKTFKKLISAILIALFVLVPLTVISVSAVSEYTDDGATYFVFTDDGITAVDGDYTDYTIKGTSLSIKGAGTYVVSGSCSNGSMLHLQFRSSYVPNQIKGAIVRMLLPRMTIVPRFRPLLPLMNSVASSMRMFKCSSTATSLP